MSSTDGLNYTTTTATTANTTASTTAMSLVVENLEEIWGQIGQVYPCIWQVAPPSGQLTSYWILSSSFTWASMSPKASRAPSNQVSRRWLRLARHTLAGFATGKKPILCQIMTWTKTITEHVCVCACHLDRLIAQMFVNRFGWYFGGWSG